MSGSRSRQKGTAGERALVKELQSWGLDGVHRCPQKDDAPDILTALIGRPLVIECKRQKKANPRAALKQVLDSEAPPVALRAVYIKDDRCDPFWVLPHSTMRALVEALTDTDVQADRKHPDDTCQGEGYLPWATSCDPTH